MKEIPLTGRHARGKVALVDDEDYPLLSCFSWSAYDKGSDGKYWYARGWDRLVESRRRVDMHRLVMGFPRGLEIDHRNGNGLDNRKDNLRVATAAQNQANQRSRRGASKYKGVHKSEKGWRARLSFHQRKISLGYFDTEEEAARAYDETAKLLWGDFAKVNFPVEGLGDDDDQNDA